MISRGSVIVLKYVLTRPIFWLVRIASIICKCTFGYSPVSGHVKSRNKSFENFPNCAHRMKVWAYTPVATILLMQMDYFHLSHLSYEDPIQAIVNSDNVTFLNFARKHAVFAVSPTGFNVYDGRHGPFTFYVQAANAVELITIPLRFFSKLGQHIRSQGNYSKKVGLLWNTGRCGSTLACKVMNNVDGFVTMSEVGVISTAYPVMKKQIDPAELCFVDGDMDKMIRDLFHYGLMIQTKGMQDKIVFIKPRGLGIPNMNLVHEVCPQALPLIMYRDPVANVKSLIPFLTALGIPISIAEPMVRAMFANLPAAELSEINQILDPLLRAYDTQKLAIMYYLGHVIHIKRASSNIKGKWHVLKYENLVNNPGQEITNLLRFFDVKVTQQMLDNCFEAFNKDSQSEHDVINKKNLDSVRRTKEGSIPEGFKDMVDEKLQLFGFPFSDDFDSLFETPS